SAARTGGTRSCRVSSSTTSRGRRGRPRTTSSASSAPASPICFETRFDGKASETVDTLLWLLLFIGAPLTLAYRRVPLAASTAVLGVPLAPHSLAGGGRVQWKRLLWVGWAAIGA